MNTKPTESIEHSTLNMHRDMRNENRFRNRPCSDMWYIFLSCTVWNFVSSSVHFNLFLYFCFFALFLSFLFLFFLQFYSYFRFSSIVIGVWYRWVTIVEVCKNRVGKGHELTSCAIWSLKWMESWVETMNRWTEGKSRIFCNIWWNCSVPKMKCHLFLSLFVFFSLLFYYYFEWYNSCDSRQF